MATFPPALLFFSLLLFLFLFILLPPMSMAEKFSPSLTFENSRKVVILMKRFEFEHRAPSTKINKRVTLFEFLMPKLGLQN